MVSNEEATALRKRQRLNSTGMFAPGERLLPLCIRSHIYRARDLTTHHEAPA